MRVQSALLKLPSVHACAAGNRLWGKELDLKLALVNWSPDGRRLLFATDTGECHIYDSNGNAITKLTLYCMVGWCQGILGGTALRLHVLSSTVLLSFGALPPESGRLGSCMSGSWEVACQAQHVNASAEAALAASSPLGTNCGYVDWGVQHPDCSSRDCSLSLTRGVGCDGHLNPDRPSMLPAKCSLLLYLCPAGGLCGCCAGGGY